MSYFGQGWSHVLLWTRLEPCPTLDKAGAMSYFGQGWSHVLLRTRLEPCPTLDKAGAMSYFRQGWSHVLLWTRLEPCPTYQTRQAFSRTMGCPALQANASRNCGMFETTPLMRYSSGECGLVMALARLLSGRSSPHAHCAMPMKKR